MKKWFALGLALWMFLLPGCGIQTSSTVTETGTQGGFAENITYTESPEVTECKTFSVHARQFGIEITKDILLSGKTIVEESINPNNGSVWVDTSDGASLSVGDGKIYYRGIDDAWDYYNLISMVYGERLAFSTDNSAELKACMESPYVQSAIEKLEKICSLSNDETLLLWAGILFSENDLMERQQQLINEEFVSAEQKIIPNGNLGENCYFLRFTLTKDGIPLAGTGEPDISTMSESQTMHSYIDIIGTGDSILLLDVAGLFDYSEKDTVAVLSASEATKIFSENFSNIVLPYPAECDRYWLEYLFVSDPNAKSAFTGTLAPYWCFQIRHDEGENGIFYSAERYNAVTGEDFAYEG